MRDTFFLHCFITTRIAETDCIIEISNYAPGYTFLQPLKLSLYNTWTTKCPLIGIVKQYEDFPIRFIVELLNKQQRIVLTGKCALQSLQSKVCFVSLHLSIPELNK